MDPFITYLHRWLKGITIYSLPTLGPQPETANERLPPMTESYKIISYADDLKPTVTSFEELMLVDRASALFEEAFGCRLHRNIESDVQLIWPQYFDLSFF